MALNSFNEKVRARIFSSSLTSISSSGSEHDTDYDVVSPSPSPSPCLSFLVQNFLEDDSTTITDSTESTSTRSDSDSDEFHRPDPTVLIQTVIYPTVFHNADPFRNHLFAHITKAIEIFSIFRKNKSIFLRNLMAYLREIGYNAGVCKIRWDSTGGLTAGNHELIDVISLESVRYFIDTDFSGEFEIARETQTYSKFRNSLPRVLVAKSDDLKRIVRLMCDEARRSLKINGLMLPPWRKNRYMQMKWLGPYRRTVNHFPAPAVKNFTVKCRCEGFDVAGDGGRLLVSPVTRTR